MTFIVFAGLAGPTAVVSPVALISACDSATNQPRRCRSLSQRLVRHGATRCDNLLAFGPPLTMAISQCVRFFPTIKNTANAIVRESVVVTAPTSHAFSAGNSAHCIACRARLPVNRPSADNFPRRCGARFTRKSLKAQVVS